MNFPTINHIDDVLPHIAGRSEFIHAQREGYSVIDYNFALADSFEDPFRLECRGIKFRPDGRILARPLHKFANVGEWPSTRAEAIDFSRPHTITEKLDGSMIHPAIVDGELVLMTRMGRTDVARKAERHLVQPWRGCTGYFADSIRAHLLRGLTPIFEFTAPDNRIVIPYETSNLSLLAMRYTVSGEYVDQEWLADAASDWNVPLVEHHSSDWATGEAFLNYARAITGREGFVLRFDDGLWVKAKGDDYVLKHKAKNSVLQEKNVLALVLAGQLDDVLPLLDPVDLDRVTRYRDDVLTGMSATASIMQAFVGQHANDNQKTFAVERVPQLAPEQRPIAFAVRSGTPAIDAVRKQIEKSLGSQTAVDAARRLHGAILDAA